MAPGISGIDDEEPDPRQVAAFERVLDMDAIADAKAIAQLFGVLPDWLPEPIRPLLEQALVTLRNAGQSPERIAELVAQGGRDELEIPATARDVTAFTQAAYYLARVQWALGLEKADALKELGGNNAAKDYRRAKAGNEAQFAARFGDTESRQARDERIRALAAQLHTQNLNLSNHAIAVRIAPRVGLSAKQVKRIIGA
jgi:predicted DsbA family dithiol-disulfide isomerase